MLAALAGAPASAVTGRGAGLTDAAFARKKAVIDGALRLHRPNAQDPIDVLSKVGGLDLAAMTGAYLGCAAARLPAVVDGFISIVAALCAVRLQPAVRDYLFLSHVSREPGYALAQALLGLSPCLMLDSVTALLANEMFSPFNPAAPEKALRALLVLGRHCRHVLCVADDIFRDAGRYTGWTEDYRAGLARICRGLAGEFDLVCEAQAGMLRVHKGRLPAGLDCQKTPLGFSDRSLQSATRRNCGP